MTPVYIARIVVAVTIVGITSIAGGIWIAVIIRSATVIHCGVVNLAGPG